MTLEPYVVLILFFSMVPLSRIINRPRALKRVGVDSLLSDLVGHDVNEIKPSATLPQMHSGVRIPPMLNMRPTLHERRIVEMEKPSSHCQNCRYCVGTAVVRNTQWIRCTNPFRVTTNGSNKHEWHKPDVKLPCYK